MSEPHKINPISFVLDNDVTQRLALKQNNLNNSTLLLGIGSNITNINYNTLSNLPDLSTYIKESTLLQNINSLYQDTNTNPTIRRNNTYTCNISNSSKITTSNLLVNDSINFSGYVYSNAEPFNMPPLDPYNSILTNYITINNPFFNSYPSTIGYMSLSFTDANYDIYVSTSQHNTTTSNQSKLFDSNVNTSCLWALNQYSSTNGTYLSTISSLNGINGDWIIIKYPFLFLLTSFTFYPSSGITGGTPSTWSCFGSMDGINFTLIQQASNSNPLQPYTYYLKHINGFYIPYYYIAWVITSLTNNSQTLQMSKLDVMGFKHTYTSNSTARISLSDSNSININNLSAGILSVQNYQSIGCLPYASNYALTVGGTISAYNGIVCGFNNNRWNNFNYYPNDAGTCIILQHPSFNGNIGPHFPNPECSIIMGSQSAAPKQPTYASIPDAFYNGVVKFSTNSTSLRYDIGTANIYNTLSTLAGTNTFNPCISLLYNGNVGIGSTLPNNKLDINGNSTIFGSVGIGTTSVNPNFGIQIAKTYNTQLRIEGGTNINAISIGSNGNCYVDSSTFIGGRFTIKDGTGNVGIGSSLPKTKLDVNGVINVTNGDTLNKPSFTSAYGGTGDRIVLYSGTTGSIYPYSIGIDTNEFWCSVPTSATYNWYVNKVSYMSLNTSGQLRVYSDVLSFSNASDEKLKDNIKPLTLDCTDLINKIKPVQFTWKDISEVPESQKNTIDYGFIAQDIEILLPHLVKELSSYKAIKYEKLTPYLVKAIQEMNMRLDKIEKILNI